jgi:alkanesulfonate monooxygenase SsuD/methylene tetrahydromethanopterin reductase-like flavin-dependent oxidoreductase (luciferase family)
VQLGVGGGASADGVAAMGGLPRSGATMVRFTEEAVQIIRQALRGGAVQTDTAQHRIAGYRAGPVPPEPIEVWVGSQGPRMLAVTDRSGDGWVCPLNIYVGPEDVPERQAIIDDAARAAGRDPRKVRRISNVIGVIGGPGRTGLVGPVEAWADALAAWAVDLGFDTFVFWPLSDAPAQLQAFASEVVPAVRARVADLRG